MTKKEQEFLRLLLLQDKEIKQLFAETINSLAGDMNHFTAVDRALIPDDIWLKNKRIEQKIEQKLLSFQGQFTSTLTQSRAEVLGISKKYGDEIINSYISNLPISSTAKEGIFLRSLEGFTTFKNKGLDISKSVWKTTHGLKDQIAFYGGSGIASGQPSKRIASDLKNYLENPDKRFRRIRDPKTGKLKLSQPAKNFHPGQGVYRSSYQNALRLAQTETNMAFRHADQYRWKEMAFVNGYEVKLSNAHPELDICDSMAGRYPKNFLFGGWHPKCICFIVPMMAPKKDFINYLKTGNLNDGNIIKTIPGSAGSYISHMAPAFRNYKSKPYFLKDNFNLRNGEYHLKKSVGIVENIPPVELTTLTPEEAIRKTEKEIRKNNFETGVFFNAKGEEVFRKSGEKFRIAFYPDEVKHFKDNIFTHNHPRGLAHPVGSMQRIGNSFSGADIFTCIRNDAAELRAVTPNFTFILKRPASGWPDLNNAKRVYERLDSELLKENWNRINNKNTTIMKAQVTHYHELSRRFAKYFKLEYIKRKDVL